MNVNIRTKIICTLGPATDDVTVLRNMMLNGMDVVRLNFSHGNIEDHLKRIRMVRILNGKYRRHVRILIDMEGYRIRIGRLKNKKPIELKKRQTVFLTKENIEGEGNLIPFDYQGPLEDICGGCPIYIDDGNIALKAIDSSKKRLKAEVVVPGILKERKGINMPDVKLRFHGLTEHDRQALDFGMKNRVDFIAQSFVRSAEDILALKRHMDGRCPEAKIISKIENREGIKNIDRIMDVCDGIMVARGDMGVSLPIWEVPMVQKDIIRRCNRRKKFVITATQMLESMTEHLRPTRAETTDVANAILDGTDYVMLSAETAVGKYPVETVRMMNQIIRFTEKSAKP